MLPAANCSCLYRRGRPGTAAGQGTRESRRKEAGSTEAEGMIISSSTMPATFSFFPCLHPKSRYCERRQRVCGREGQGDESQDIRSRLGRGDQFGTSGVDFVSQSRSCAGSSQSPSDSHQSAVYDHGEGSPLLARRQGLAGRTDLCR